MREQTVGRASTRALAGRASTGALAGRASTLALAALALVMFSRPHASRADNFQKVVYDPARDELVIVVLYRGTNPDHQFSLKWRPCIDRGNNQHEIVADLLDQQFEDPEQNDYGKTVRMSLADMNCRPAAVTLRTAPKFYYTLTVPERGASTTRP